VQTSIVICGNQMCYTHVFPHGQQSIPACSSLMFSICQSSAASTDQLLFDAHSRSSCKVQCLHLLITVLAVVMGGDEVYRHTTLAPSGCTVGTSWDVEAHAIMMSFYYVAGERHCSCCCLSVFRSS
jgi:hypothetical protein